MSEQKPTPIPNELRYYLALQTIAKRYMTCEQLRSAAKREYGLSYQEVLEMAYENVRDCAKDAIYKKRAPRIEEPSNAK